MEERNSGLEIPVSSTQTKDKQFKWRKLPASSRPQTDSSYGEVEIVVRRDKSNDNGVKDITVNLQLKLTVKTSSRDGNRSADRLENGPTKSMSEQSTDVEANRVSTKKYHGRPPTPYRGRLSTERDIDLRSQRLTAPSVTVSQCNIDGVDNLDGDSEDDFDDVNCPGMKYIFPAFMFGLSIFTWMFMMWVWIYVGCNFVYYGVPNFSTQNHNENHVPFYMPSRFCPKYVESYIWSTPSNLTTADLELPPGYIPYEVHIGMIITIAAGAGCWFSFIWPRYEKFCITTIESFLNFIARMVCGITDV